MLHSLHSMLCVTFVYVRDITNMILKIFAHECKSYECLLFLLLLLLLFDFFLVCAGNIVSTDIGNQNYFCQVCSRKKDFHRNILHWINFSFRGETEKKNINCEGTCSFELTFTQIIFSWQDDCHLHGKWWPQANGPIKLWWNLSISHYAGRNKEV